MRLYIMCCLLWQKRLRLNCDYLCGLWCKQVLRGVRGDQCHSLCRLWRRQTRRLGLVQIATDGHGDSGTYKWRHMVLQVAGTLMTKLESHLHSPHRDPWEYDEQGLARKTPQDNTRNRTIKTQSVIPLTKIKLCVTLTKALCHSNYILCQN
jgi:hypothetical protein